jgi:membrane protease YdiL (CAAX protease family)
MNQPLLPRPRFWAEAALQKQTGFTLLGETLIFFLVYFLASLLQGAAESVILAVWLLRDHPEELSSLSSHLSGVQETVLNLIATAPEWVIVATLYTFAIFGAAAFIYCRKYEKRSGATLGMRAKQPLPELCMGLAAGLLMMLGVVGIGTAIGAFEPETAALDPASLPLLLAALLGCGVQAMSQELLFHGYFAPSLNKNYPVWVAVLVSSVLYVSFGTGIQAVTGIGSVNMFLLALVLCIYTMKRGNLLGACAVHTMWQFTHNYLFGFYYETNQSSSVIPVRLDQYRKAITGSVGGPEAGLCATVVLIVALGLALALRARDPAPREPVEPEPEE